MSNPDKQVNLDNLLRELAARATAPASSAREDGLRIACRTRTVQLRKRRYRRIAVGIAACLLLGFGWQWHASDELAIPAEANYAGFMALPYAQSDVPMEQAVIVRINLQPADLAGLGLPPTLLGGGKRTRADLLIGQDGIARAVRLTQ